MKMPLKCSFMAAILKITAHKFLLFEGKLGIIQQHAHFQCSWSNCSWDENVQWRKMWKTTRFQSMANCCILVSFWCSELYPLHIHEILQTHYETPGITTWPSASFVFYYFNTVMLLLKLYLVSKKKSEPKQLLSYIYNKMK